MRWRRLCVDVTDDGEVIGGSVEFYNDLEYKPTTVFVLARTEWRGKHPVELLEKEMSYEWPDGQLAFVFTPCEEF